MTSKEEHAKMHAWVSKTLGREITYGERDVIFVTLQAIIKELERIEESINRLWDKAIFKG